MYSKLGNHDVKLWDLRMKLHFDVDYPVHKQIHAAQNVADAIRTVSEIYGERSFPHLDFVFAWDNKEFKEYFTGKDHRSAFFPPNHRASDNGYLSGNATIAIINKPGDGSHRNVLVHELVHFMHYSILGSNKLPQWCDEGIATLISNEPKCDHNNCEGTNHIDALRAGEDFTKFTTPVDRRTPTYCQCAKEVKDWIGNRQKSEVISLLLDQISKGKAFGDVYERLKVPNA